MAQITGAQLVGDTYQSSQGSRGTATQNADGSYSYTSQASLNGLANSLTVTSSGPGVEDFTAMVSGGIANGNSINATILANDGGDVLATATVPGIGTFFIYETNNPANQPATGATITVPAIAANNPYTYMAAPAVCFTSGTLIRTVRGDVAVESLAVGDFALTASGARRAIVWIGHQTLNCRNHPRPGKVMPVRIAADAFGRGKPARDLWVSPGHAICVNVMDEVLIPASSMVNGSTITRMDVEEVTYWHVELDGGHAILLADGLPAESYIDCGNRAFFGSGAGAVDPERDAATLADYCRPFYVDGPLVEAVRGRLDELAIEAGWTKGASPFADIHVEAGGARIEPTIDGLCARFAIPAGTADAWLVSHSVVPAEALDMPDARRLGLFIARLSLDDGRMIALDDERLGAGFHAVEPCEGGARRWTNGRARLPAALWDQRSVTLAVDLAGPALPHWVRPASAEAGLQVAA